MVLHGVFLAVLSLWQTQETTGLLGRTSGLPCPGFTCLHVTSTRISLRGPVSSLLLADPRPNNNCHWPPTSERTRIWPLLLSRNQVSAVCWTGCERRYIIRLQVRGENTGLGPHRRRRKEANSAARLARLLGPSRALLCSACSLHRISASPADALPRLSIPACARPLHSATAGIVRHMHTSKQTPRRC